MEHALAGFVDADELEASHATVGAELHAKIERGRLFLVAEQCLERDEALLFADSLRKPTEPAERGRRRTEGAQMDREITKRGQDLELPTLDVELAAGAFDEVLEILRIVGNRASEALVSFNMGFLLSKMARMDDAAVYMRRAITLAEETGHPALDRMRAFLDELEQTTKG